MCVCSHLAGILVIIAQGLHGSDGKKSAWMQEIEFSLGGEDPLEKGMSTDSSILAWRIPWAEEPGRLPPMGLQRVRHNWVINIFTFTLVIILRQEADGPLKG